jgi:regulator of protease activity HflC (stomatin/prohibitin superfamily)
LIWQGFEYQSNSLQIKYSSNQIFAKSNNHKKMFITLLGFALILLAGSLGPVNPAFTMITKSGRTLGILMVLIGLATSCFVQIDPGVVGVQKLFGKIQEGVVSEGLNFVNPLVNVVKFDVRTQNYTMSGVHSEGEKEGDDAIKVLSSDGLEVGIDLTVLYRVQADKAAELLRTVGVDYKDKIVRPLTRTKIRDFSVYYDAISLYSTKREEFQQKIFQSIDKEFKERGLVLEQLLVRNINLPLSVKQTIESKINAEQESQKMKFVLDKERQEADRKRVEAQGIADYQKILTSSLTDKLLQYEQIKAQKELSLSPNAKVVVMGGGKSSPIILGQ